MRHINDFPAFTPSEIDALSAKILGGVIESVNAADPAHVARAALEGKEWVKYPCWLSATKWSDGKGFKKFKFKKHSLYIHRASYECFVGPIPPGKLADHLCRVRGCCQYMHLEPVTTKENIERGANENHLMREGAPPPVSAKKINPDFFKEPTLDEIKVEFDRRQHEGRDIKRSHSMIFDGPLPQAPAGFEWQVSNASEALFYLNPIREPESGLDYARRYAYPAVAAVEFEAAAQTSRFLATVRAYEPCRDAVIGDIEFGTIPPEAWRGNYPPLDNAADAAKMQKLASRMFVEPTRSFEALAEQFPTYEPKAVPVFDAVEDPTDPHNDPFYLKLPQNGTVPENWLRRQLLRLKTWLNGEWGS